VTHVLELVVTKVILKATVDIFIGILTLARGVGEYIISIAQRLLQISIAAGTTSRGMDGLATRGTVALDLAI
jgi:hypothetical protein